VPDAWLRLRKSSASNADKFPLRLGFLSKNGEFVAGKRGLRIAQLAMPKLKASFNFA